jgi:hypothetical protein
LKFYVSTGPTFDASAIRLGSRPVPALEPGTTDGATTPVPLPATVGTASLYYILAVLDPDGIFGEYDEGNNVKWFKIKIGPDLHVSALSTTGIAVPGGSISVQDTRRNRGVSASPRVGHKVLPRHHDHLQPFSHTPGEQSAASTQVTLPAGVGGGTFYLLVIADGNNEISEPLETNNLKYLTVVIP